MSSTTSSRFPFYQIDTLKRKVNEQSSFDKFAFTNDRTILEGNSVFQVKHADNVTTPIPTALQSESELRLFPMQPTALELQDMMINKVSPVMGTIDTIDVASLRHPDVNADGVVRDSYSNVRKVGIHGKILKHKYNM